MESVFGLTLCVDSEQKLKPLFERLRDFRTTVSPRIPLIVLVRHCHSGVASVWVSVPYIFTGSQRAVAFCPMASLALWEAAPWRQAFQCGFHPSRFCGTLTLGLCFLLQLLQGEIGSCFFLLLWNLQDLSEC